MTNNKQEAFALFDQGKTPTSPEVKALNIKGHTKRNYYWLWQQTQEGQIY